MNILHQIFLNKHYKKHLMKIYISPAYKGCRLNNMMIIDHNSYHLMHFFQKYLWQNQHH